MEQLGLDQLGKRRRMNGDSLKFFGSVLWLEDCKDDGYEG